MASALTYGDLTTDPQGRWVDPAARLPEIIDRCGPASVAASHDPLLVCADAVLALLDDALT